MCFSVSLDQFIPVLFAFVVLGLVFSKRQRITLRLLYTIGRPSVLCLSVCLSSVCRL